MSCFYSLLCTVLTLCMSVCMCASFSIIIGLATRQVAHSCCCRVAWKGEYNGTAFNLISPRLYVGAWHLSSTIAELCKRLRGTPWVMKILHVPVSHHLVASKGWNDFCSDGEFIATFMSTKNPVLTQIAHRYTWVSLCSHSSIGLNELAYGLIDRVSHGVHAIYFGSFTFPNSCKSHTACVLYSLVLSH